MDAARYAALFAAESREHLATIDTALLALEQAPSFQSQAAPLAAVFRAMHTIKGMAGAMGHESVEQLAHALESRCEPLRAGQEALSPAILDVLFDGTSLLREAIDASIAATGTGARGASDAASASASAFASPASATLTQRVRSIVERLESHARSPETTALSTQPSAPSAHVPQPAADDAPAAGAHTNVRHVDIRLTADCPLKGVRALLVLGKLKQVGLVGSTHPAQAQWEQESFDGVFRVILVTGADDEQIAQAARSAGDVAQVSVRRPRVTSSEERAANSLRPARSLHDMLAVRSPKSATPSAERPALTDVLRAPGGRGELRGDARGDSRLDGRLDGRLGDAGRTTVRVDASRLDALLDLMGELVITRDRLTRAIDATEHPDREVQRAAHEASRIIAALQDEVLQARLLPIAQVFDRFPRLVRDMARELGKDIRFVTEGRELTLDRALLDALADPVLHLIRNAVDHGLEDQQTRQANGKPAAGELIVRAARDRATVVVQVQDDGRGINRETVRARAIALELLPADHTADIDDELLLALIAHPGFSTAKRVSRVSGRGVGVDVVITSVRALGGQLELESIEGVGTVVTMRLPASLAITRALLVQVGGDVFALPAAHVDEVMAYHPDLRVPGHAGAVTIRDEVIPLVALGERFGLAPDETADPHVAVVEVGGKRAAVVVDGVLAQQDIVVKPLDVIRGSAAWFSGATVLGDGSPALIVDVSSVV